MLRGSTHPLVLVTLALALLLGVPVRAQSPTDNFGPGLGRHQPRRTIDLRQMGQALFRDKTRPELNAEAARAENHLYGKSYPDDSLKRRVERMENTLFGQEGDGELAQRLERVHKQIHQADITNTQAEASEAMVNYLERKLFQRNYDDPLPQRLTRLESHVFGKTFEHYPQDVRLKKLTYTIPIMAKEIRVTRGDGTLVATTRNTDTENASKSSAARQVKTPDGQTIITGDFIEHIHRPANGRFLRWAKLPVKVYGQNASEAQEKLLKDALAIWSAVFPLAMANSPYEADVLVNWQPTVNKQQALTHPMLHLDTERAIRTVVSINMSPYPQERQWRGLLHQLGHAAGLWGHSPFPSDIMYPALTLEYRDIPVKWARRSPEPSDLFRDRMPDEPAPSLRDVNTLKRVYNQEGTDLRSYSPFK